MDIERRKFQRIHSSLDVRWEVPAAIGSAAQISNLSVNGCYIETKDFDAEGVPNVGQLISFVILLPEDAALRVSGRVMYKNPPLGFGVLFNPLTSEQQDLISSYLRDMAVYFSAEEQVR